MFAASENSQNSGNNNEAEIIDTTTKQPPQSPKKNTNVALNLLQSYLKQPTPIGGHMTPLAVSDSLFDL